ncbi:hypothetical protein NDU88_002338 [Pleurodeles waltl]|uniref:Secreted protein n=1 Tax=Pleurodeles waltl TaxID=8319 RepID=A0AAV7L0Z6_PLEWA|nr:hypothetical protein NDU88_002338 [Pleurodeles waltl]
MPPRPSARAISSALFLQETRAAGASPSSYRSPATSLSQSEASTYKSRHLSPHSANTACLVPKSGTRAQVLFRLRLAVMLSLGQELRQRWLSSRCEHRSGCP